MPRDAGQGSEGGAATRRQSTALDAELAQLEALDAEGLRQSWERHFGAPAPSALPPRLLLLAIAYDLQAAALGGLTKVIEQRLGRIAEGDAPTSSAQPASVRLKPGATLLRDWGGQAYRVEVLADGGFSFEGQVWRSLSAITREITGTNRNGPAFFGLRAGGANGSK